jgi:ribosomal protein S18 acetylase RimI-like enzyme
MEDVPGEIVLRKATDSDLDLVRILFREYAAEIKVDLCFQDFEAELATLPGKYAQPAGVILLAERGNAAVGVVAVRPISTDICEMKRLYLRPEARGLGVGAKLVDSIIAYARAAGYQRIVLDTLVSMASAMTLYQSRGFQRIDPYYQNPHSALFFALDLN